MRIASELTVATTSPVGTVRVSASPVSAAWCPMSWAERKAPWSQLATAYLWRSAPENALTVTSPTRTPHHSTSEPGSAPMMPSSMALPIAAGKSAWLTSHTMPKAIAMTSVRHCPLPTHLRYAVGLVRSGVPGSAWGSEDHLPHFTSAGAVPHAIFRRAQAVTGGVQATSRPGRKQAQAARKTQVVGSSGLAAEGVGQLVDLEGALVDVAVAVGRATDQVGGDRGGEELSRSEQDEGRDRRPGAQGRRETGEDEDEAEGLRLRRGVQARQGVGEADQADGPGEAEEGAEQQADGADDVEHGRPAHRWPPVGSVGGRVGRVGGPGVGRVRVRVARRCGRMDGAHRPRRRGRRRRGT